MAVYIDDASIPATVRNGARSHTSAWCHLTADTQEELHEFAARLGLKRSYFQPGKPLGGKPSPFWHYDLTAGKRAQAVRLGAVEVSAREMPALMRARAARRQAPGEQLAERPRLLFTSSRDGVTEAEVETALRLRFTPGKTLVTGGARGGDQIAERFWRQWGGQVDSHPVSPAAWRRSRGAGYARNAQMVAEVKATGGECLAVIARCADSGCAWREPHGTHGAVHCAGLAEAAGLPVTRIKAGADAWESDIKGTAQAEPAATRHGRHYPPGVALPEGICPGCRSSALLSGRTKFQACGALKALRQRQEEEMFGREKRAAAKAEAARQAEADALFAEADRWADLAGEPRDFRQEITRERAARVMEQIAEPLVRDARTADAEPELSGAERDAEIDRLAGLFPEPEASMPEPWDRLMAGSDAAQAARQQEQAAAAAQRIALGEQREHPGPQASAAAAAAGRELQDAKAAHALADAEAYDAATWLQLAGTAPDPLSQTLGPRGAMTLAPVAATLPDGTPHADPFLAGRGWQAQGGLYVRQPQTQTEAG
jgi:hypothetical protein